MSFGICVLNVNRSSRLVCSTYIPKKIPERIERPPVSGTAILQWPDDEELKPDPQQEKLELQISRHNGQDEGACGDYDKALLCCSWTAPQEEADGGLETWSNLSIALTS